MNTLIQDMQKRTKLLEAHKLKLYMNALILNYIILQLDGKSNQQPYFSRVFETNKQVSTNRSHKGSNQNTHTWFPVAQLALCLVEEYYQ